MSKHSAVIVLLALQLLQVSEGLAQSQAMIRVGTFNCEFLIRETVHVKFGHPLELRGPVADQWAQPGYRDARFTEAAQAVACVIAAMNADVIALVEVGNRADVTELRDQVRRQGQDFPYVAVGESLDMQTKQNVAVLSKLPLVEEQATIPGTETYDRELDDPESEEEAVVSKGMQVRLRMADGQLLRLFVVHLASERGGHEQDELRIAQASIVRRTYLPYLLNGEHVIVAGDVNDHPGQPAERRIRGRDDIYPDLVQSGHVKYVAGDQLETRWTYQFQGIRRQIDHILLSPSLLKVSVHETVRSEFLPVEHMIPGTSIPASDHRPVVANIPFVGVPATGNR